MQSALTIKSPFEQLSRIDPIPDTLIITNDMRDAKENCVPIIKKVFIFFVLSANSDSCKIP